MPQTTKLYIEIPLEGDILTDDETREFASFIESAVDAYGQVPGQYAGREIHNVRVYKNAADLTADLEGEAV